MNYEVEDDFREAWSALDKSIPEEAVAVWFDCTGDTELTGIEEAYCGRWISDEAFVNAVEILILRHDVHLDQLAHKLMEDRVMPIVQKILVGENVSFNQKSIMEDKQYLIDLGLVKQNQQGGLEIANPIYREIIPRELTDMDQSMLRQDRDHQRATGCPKTT